jgi:hypothetical protein
VNLPVLKKFLVTILVLFYFVATTGATVHVHYCMGELISWKLWHKEDPKKKCSKCGMTEKKGCCEDQHHLVKMEDDHNVVEPKMLFPDLHFQIFIAVYPDLQTFIISTPIIANPSNHGPPRTGKVAVFVRNCVYRI